MKSSDKKELLNFKNKNITETLDEITSIKQHQEINLSKNKFYVLPYQFAIMEANTESPSNPESKKVIILTLSGNLKR